MKNFIELIQHNTTRGKSFFGIEKAFIAAAMAGGITTPEFVAAVSNVGGIGSLATGYLFSSQVKEALQKISSLTSKPFIANVFVPQNVHYDEKKIQTVQALLAPYYEELQLPMPDPSAYKKIDADFEEILTILYQHKISYLSVVFGCLSQDHIKQFQAIGTKIIGTATTPREAEFLAKQGCDAIIAQGIEAGGHRGSFLDDAEAGIGIMSLLPLIHEMDLGLPIFAAGGLSTPNQLLSALLLGAQGCVVGTALLATKESGAATFYKQRLAARVSTTRLTPNLTGKYVRALVPNDLDNLIRQACITPPDYPIMHLLTQPLRKAHPEHFGSYWAGQSYPLILHNKSVQDVVDYLYQDLEML